jgi:hypothetical protein
VALVGMVRNWIGAEFEMEYNVILVSSSGLAPDESAIQLSSSYSSLSSLSSSSPSTTAVFYTCIIYHYHLYQSILLTTTVFHFSVSPEPNFSHTHATSQLNPASVAPPLILILLMASVPHPGSAQSSLQLPQDGSPSTLSWEGEKMFVGHCFFLFWSYRSDLFCSLGSISIFTTIATSEDFGRLLVSS